METKTMTSYEFREFFMNDIASYVDRFKSDLFIDIATMGKFRSNKTVYFFFRKYGSHLVFRKKYVEMYADNNELAYKFQFVFENKHLKNVVVTELDINTLRSK